VNAQTLRDVGLSKAGAQPRFPQSLSEKLIVTLVAVAFQEVPLLLDSELTLYQSSGILNIPKQDYPNTGFSSLNAETANAARKVA
jgi:hypothetical protein